MAKVEGAQTIPSEDWDQYRQLLTLKLNDGSIRLRCPFTRPKSRSGGVNESDKQRAQRTRFLDAKASFGNVPEESRSRWYDTAPEWNSYLWYYNWFMLSAIMGVTGVPGKGEAVIKGIQHKSCQIGSGGGVGTVTYTSIDANRAVFMIDGAGINEFAEGVAVPCYPYEVTHDATVASFKFSLDSAISAYVGVTIIEYI